MKRSALLLLFGVAACLLAAQVQPLRLLSPNGGEVWYTGSTHAITWEYADVWGNVNLYLIGPNGTSTNAGLIAQGIPVQACQYLWAIPNSVIPSPGYRVMITLAPAGPATASDVSDGPFTIAGGYPTPSITVTGPNGGETWQTGSTHNITWNYQNLEGSVMISLVSDNNSPQVVIAAEVPITDQSYAWTIPATISPGQYKVHIVWLSVLDVYIGDMSDGFFTITNDFPTPSITVVSPNGGEVWPAGSTQTITWTYENLSGEVYITLYEPNTWSHIVISDGTPIETGSYAWTIPVAIQPGQYKVHVVWLSDLTVYFGDMSDDFFTIVNLAPQPLTVTRPNGGEVWRVGRRYNITWLDDFGPSNSTANTVDIFLALDVPVIPFVIAWNAPNTGVYSWRIPLWVRPNDHYKVMIVNRQGESDQSDNFFTIRRCFAISIVADRAGGGCRISVSGVGPEPVSVKVYNLKGQCVRKLADNRKLEEGQVLAWDGKNSLGREVPEGIYLVRAVSGQETATRKMTILKQH